MFINKKRCWGFCLPAGFFIFTVSFLGSKWLSTSFAPPSLLPQAFANINELLEGEWAWASNQCRDQYLNASSARSVAKPEMTEVEFPVLVFRSGGVLSLLSLVGESREERSARYYVSSNRIEITHDTTPSFYFYMDENDNLVAEDAETKDVACYSSERFARIYGKVNK